MKMEPVGGYTGYILRVNLSDNSVTKEENEISRLRKYLGGSGLAARILWDETRPMFDALSSESKLVFSTGPLTGTLCPSGGSYELCFKSPLTHAWCQSRSGGSFGAKMKAAGFDHIVIEGRASEPAYLVVQDGQARLEPAKHLWGKGVMETTDIVLEAIGNHDASVACIGQAGENAVKFAAVINDKGRAAGRGGGGAVMGSKGLKAIVVDGYTDITVAHPEAFYSSIVDAEDALLRYPFESVNQFGTPLLVGIQNANGSLPTKYFALSQFDDASKLSGEALAEGYLIKRKACFGCSMGCGRYSEVGQGLWKTPPSDGPEYETLDMLGALLLNSDMESVIKMNYVCNDYGVDTISMGAVIGFCLECHEQGILPEEYMKAEDWQWGDPCLISSLIEKTCMREGIGSLLAEGVRLCAEKFGEQAKRIALHVKGLEMPGHEPRGESKTLALQYAVTPRGCCHMHPNWAGCWDGGLFDNGLIELGLPWPPPDKMAECGSRKGFAYKLIALQGEISEVLGTCIFHSWGTSDSCLTPKRYSDMVSAITGWDIDQYELMKIAERSWNIKKCFNLREGILREDDCLPLRMRTPLPSGPAKGQKVENLERMLHEYYEACGWDVETSRPTRRKLEELELEDMAESISMSC